jgi:hypothetical protein
MLGDKAAYLVWDHAQEIIATGIADCATNKATADDQCRP